MKTLVLLLLLHLPAAASGWMDVRSLQPGSRIKLVMKAGDVECLFVAANADTLVIHLKKGDFGVDRISIRRLDRRLPGSNRGRNIERGLGLGLAAGIARGFYNTGENGLGRAMLTMPFMAAGMISGATASAVRWETVYRR